MDTPHEQRRMLEVYCAAWRSNLTAWLVGDEMYLDDQPIPSHLLKVIPVDDIPVTYPY